MKKLNFILAVLLISFGASTTAYAGSINSNEQAVISAAQQTYMYNGTAYKVAPSYIGQLQAYLMQDDIDLTAAQRDKALASVNGYIERGVKEGYLVPVNGQSSQQNSGAGNPATNTGNNNSGSGTTPSGAGQNSTDKQADTVNNSGSGNSTTGNSNTDKTTTNNQNSGNISEQNKDTINLVVGKNKSVKKDTKKSTKKSTKKNKKKSTKKSVKKKEISVFLDDLFSGKNRKVAAGDNSSDLNQDANSATDNSGLEAGNTIIKDTGFDFGTTLAVVAFLGVVMISGIIVTVRHNYFAHSEE